MHDQIFIHTFIATCSLTPKTRDINVYKYELSFALIIFSHFKKQNAVLDNGGDASKILKP